MNKACLNSYGIKVKTQRRSIYKQRSMLQMKQNSVKNSEMQDNLNKGKSKMFTARMKEVSPSKIKEQPSFSQLNIQE